MDRAEAAGLSKKQTQKHLKKLLEDVRDDAALLDELQLLAEANPHFHGLAHIWGPKLYRRNRSLFMPFLERFVRAWQLEFKRCEDWLDEIEANQDIALFRRVYPAKTLSAAWGRHTKIWVEDMLAAFERAETGAERRIALEMYDMWWQVPDALAAKLYRIDADATVDHILEKLGRLSEWDEAPPYPELIEEMQQAGDERYWEMYRRCVPPGDWKRDVIKLAEDIADKDVLDEQLEKHHPTNHAVPDPSETYIDLVERRGEAVLPYLMRHIEEFDGPGSTWQRLANLVWERQWWPLWQKIVGRYLRPQPFNDLAVKLAECNDGRGEPRRLMDLSGAKHLSWQGQQPHHLRPDAALVLYEKQPQIARGALREHFIPRYDYEMLGFIFYEDVAKAAVRAGDEAFVDFLAGIASGASSRWYREENFQGARWYVDYYERLKKEPVTFARRAARALGNCEALEGIYKSRARTTNPVYKTLFGDPALFLEAPETVEDLIEASAPQVRELGFRALAQDDPRARKMASHCLVHLLAAPFEDHPREVLTGVFDTLIRLAGDEPALAGVILNRLREAADLREPPFSRPRLVQAIARLLHEQPELRKPSESPTVYQWQKEPA